ncbi:MAG: ATP-grasp domain-containing protein [Deltaproteobacteria bacterium]|nr:MAG: ATP-grasp domain-containing protein [Deltaproteobacteria bacterium]TMQ23993.1 MAG: ATP-grasp domain-containing protein [Deltaproteobacteria bacterium]
MSLFHRILIANRGEVAVRVARACDQLGIAPVFAASEADRDAPYLRGREVVVLGPGRAAQSYLDVERVVQAAVQARCSALHPGWGFLSENPLLATLCAQHGVTFIGPPPQVTALMGSKTRAKAAMRAAGLDVIPGSEGVLASADDAREAAAHVGFPVLFKAENGGGGRGMRIARSPAEVDTAYAEAQAEARAAFGGDRVYLEKLVEGGRHVEIQIFGDRHGRAVHLGERDCTVQRNHQKLIEESPSPAIDADLRARTTAAAARAAAAVGYVGAGTMELLLDGDVLRFMEMNCRLQVEHTVSEMRSGRDLVVAQIEVAAGRPLAWRQADIELTGCAIECRINAEDPARDFQPAPGTVTAWRPPSGAGIRVDTHVTAGYVVPPFYDSLLAKVIVLAADRDAAIDRMLAALSAFEVAGVPTTIPMHLAILRSAAFRSGRYDTRSIPGWPP